MKFTRTSICLMTGSIIFMASVQAALASCVPVRTINDLDIVVRGNLAGDFCLKNNLDFKGKENFRPIGASVARPFTGTFDGEGHVIRRLSILPAQFAGLFGVISGAQVQRLKLAGGLLQSDLPSSSQLSYAGLIAGVAINSLLQDVHATGSVNCATKNCWAGGLVGDLSGSEIRDSSSAAWVAGISGGVVGGLVASTSGSSVRPALIFRSYASGRAYCTTCLAGGLVGRNGGTIKYSFAVGPVEVVHGRAAGLVADNGSNIQESYASGLVEGRSIQDSHPSSFVSNNAGTMWHDFGVGRVSHGYRPNWGGFVDEAQPGAKNTNSFFDRETTRRCCSAQGTALTTAQFQSALPTGFAGTIWEITKGYSYPYLKQDKLFASTLATVVNANNVFTFVPIEQLEPTEYASDPKSADLASLAACYTMIARAIGITRNNSALNKVKIDQPFWNDTTKTATWAGPVTGYATVSSFIALGSGDAIDDGNIIGPLKARNVVVVRGRYQRTNGGTGVQWMLATLFTSNDSSVTTSLVANDPWTGTQVRIDPTTRMVISPTSFPLKNFRVDGYRVVTLN